VAEVWFELIESFHQAMQGLNKMVVCFQEAMKQDLKLVQCHLGLYPIKWDACFVTH